jgi:membrane protease subunit HflC
MTKKQNPYLLAGLSFAALLLFAVPSAIFTVNETQQALVLQFGEIKQQITKPGLAFKIPVIQEVRFFDQRILNVDPPSEEVLLSDQKRLVVDAFARYRITDMLQFFQALGNEQRANDRLQNIINANLRNTLGKAPLTDVLSEKREDLMAKIQDGVNKDAERFGIEVVNVRIVRADLPIQTSESIFARMRSEREQEAKQARAEGAEKAQKITADADRERRVLLADAERKAQGLRGDGDEESIKIYSSAFGRDPEFYAFYRSMEAYKKSLSDPETTLVLSPDNAFFKYFNRRALNAP